MGGGQHGALRRAQPGHRTGGQGREGLDDDGGDGAVQVGGGLVQEYEPRAGPVRGVQAGQEAGDRDPPALPRTQIGRVPLLETLERHGGQHGGANGTGQRTPGGQVQFAGDRALGQHGVLPDPEGAFRVDSGDPAGGLGGVLAQQAGQQTQDGGLAGAGGPGQRGQATRERAEVEPPEHLPSGQPNAQVPNHDAAVPVRPGGRRERLEHGSRDGGVGRGPGAGLGLAAVLGGVVGRADLAQRQVDLGGEDEDHQAVEKRHLPVHQAQSDEHRHDGHGQGGDQLEGETGEECGAQRDHRGRVVPLGDLLQSAALDAGPVESDEHRQAAGELQQVPGQPVEPVLGGIDALLGVAAHQDHEQGNQGQGDGGHHGGDEVVGEDPHAQGRRDHGGGGQRGQGFGVVVVQALEAVGDQDGIGAGTGASAVGGGQPLGDDGGPHLLLGPQRGTAAHHALPRLRQGTQGHPGRPEQHGAAQGLRGGHRAHGGRRVEQQLQQPGGVLGVQGHRQAGDQPGQGFGEQDPAERAQHGKGQQGRQGATCRRGHRGPGPTGPARMRPGRRGGALDGRGGGAAGAHSGSTRWASGMWVSARRRRNIQ